MKRFMPIAIALMFLSNNTLAGLNPDWDDPYKPFDATKYTNRTVSVTWITVKAEMIREVCDKESKKKGYRGYPNAVNACAFWKDDVCTVYTPETTAMHTVGHEMRHCFQGAWH